METLPILTKNNVKRVLGISGDFISLYISKDDNSTEDMFISNNRIRNVHIQKIDDLFEKETQLTIYNVEIQIAISISTSDDRTKYVDYILTIGNTNSLK